MTKKEMVEFVERLFLKERKLWELAELSNMGINTSVYLAKTIEAEKAFKRMVDEGER